MWGPLSKAFLTKVVAAWLSIRILNNFGNKKSLHLVIPLIIAKALFSWYYGFVLILRMFHYYSHKFHLDMFSKLLPKLYWMHLFEKLNCLLDLGLLDSVVANVLLLVVWRYLYTFLFIQRCSFCGVHFVNPSSSFFLVWDIRASIV